MFSLTKQKDISWDEWLELLHKHVTSLGYLKYNTALKGESFSYCKTVSRDSYQICLLVYDFRKFISVDQGANKISIQFECLFNDIDFRMDLTVSKSIEIEEFEKMANHFYRSMKQFK